ncbi:MAG: tetratricopeptide repeat protein [Sandaracinaceae bacterium]|nr:tetratricopeptide repeat protein [Sandaracinaceae bacterium]
MSFFKRLFGSTTETEDLAEADRLFEAKSYFEARLAYERLKDRRDASATTKKHADARISVCFDQLAEARIAEAERLIKDGELELARGELETAAELARTESIRKRAARMLDGAERRDARKVAQLDVHASDDERWAMLAGAWSETQLEEYDEYGEPLRRALLAMDAGDPTSARPILEELARDHEGDGVYLFVELARARSRTGDETGGLKALSLFLDRVPDDDRSEARIHGYVFLAQIAERDGNDEKAIEELQRAIDAMPDDPRPLLNMGVFLRTRGEPEPAVTILEAALSLLDEEQPNWPVHLELALAKRDAGRRTEAIETLERIVRYFLGRSQTDLPAAVAVPLAELHEQTGNLGRAADLYSTLARGSDRENHVVYHREAGRLLKQLGLRQEARRMLTRASALADKSSEISHDIEDILAELEKDEE